MENKAVVKQNMSISTRFTNKIMQEFSGTIGDGVKFDKEKKRLSQHLFVKIDASLKEADARRKPNATPVTWENVNMQKLALDAVYRIELGLDALIENHISIIPYFNGKLQKYDVDLRIGYSGKDYYRQKFAIDPPKKIIYHLVHETDELTFTPQDSENPIEKYTFKVPNPLKRGAVIGGFGYMVYEDETKNKFIPVSMAEILRAEKSAQSKKFWDPFRDRMQYKTLVNIVTHGRNLPTDPAKVSESYFKVEHQEAIEAGEKEEVETIEISHSEVVEDKTESSNGNQQENNEQPDSTHENEQSPAPQNQNQNPDFMKD
jgi:recombination protein RecT